MNKIIAAIERYFSCLCSKHLTFICVIIIGAAYINSLGVYFIWDDYALIAENPHIRNLGFDRLFSPAYEEEGSNSFRLPVYLRSLQILSYALDYKVWRLNPWGYHITNIALHAINAVLIYFLFLLLFKDKIISFLSAALFAVNPIFTSSVTYIAGRADILLLLFSISTLLLFIKSMESGALNPFYYLLSLLCFTCILLSKEIGGVCIFFLFLADKLICKYSKKIISYWVYLPFIALFFLYQYLKPPSVMIRYILPANIYSFFLDYLTVVKSLFIYTFLSVIPLELRMGRSIEAVAAFSDKWSYISIIFSIICGLLLVLGIKKNKLLLFGLTWFFLPLFLSSVFNNLFARRANQVLLPEHNLYFPYLGLLIIIFALLSTLWPKADIKKALIIVLLCVVPIYAALTILHNTFWQDEIRFYERMNKYNKGSAFNFLSYANLGIAYEKNKSLRLAERYFIKAAESSANDPYFYNNLAAFYLRARRFARALETLEFSRRLDADYPNTYLLLGIAYMSAGGYPEARDNFNRVLALDPDNKSARHYLGLLQSR